MDSGVTVWELQEMIRQLDRDGKINVNQRGGPVYVNAVLIEALTLLEASKRKVNA
jgi:hypothetical protein